MNRDIFSGINLNILKILQYSRILTKMRYWSIYMAFAAVYFFRFSLPYPPAVYFSSIECT